MIEKVYKMTTEKKELKTVVLELLNKIFDVSDMEGMCKIYFTKEELKEKEIVRKWKEEGWGDDLREVVTVRSCRSLSPKKEENLNERDIITILKKILKKMGYDVVGAFDTYKKTNSKTTYMCKSIG